MAATLWEEEAGASGEADGWRNGSEKGLLEAEEMEVEGAECDGTGAAGAEAAGAAFLAGGGSVV